jgi:hypothetical protein
MSALIICKGIGTCYKMFSLYIVDIELFVSKRLWHMTHLFSKYSGVIEHEGKHSNKPSKTSTNIFLTYHWR